MFSSLQMVEINVGCRVFEARQLGGHLLFWVQGQPDVRGIMPYWRGVKSFSSEDGFKSLFWRYWRKGWFGRVLSWPQNAGVPASITLSVNHTGLCLVNERGGTSLHIPWNGE